MATNNNNPKLDKEWQFQFEISQSCGEWDFSGDEIHRIEVDEDVKACKECFAPSGTYHIIGCEQEICPNCEKFFANGCKCHVCNLND